MNTKIRFALLSAALTLAALTAVAELSSAAECRKTCNLDRRDCLYDARTFVLGCKQACRANVAAREIGACMRNCSVQFAGKRGDCAVTRTGCWGRCDEPGGGTGGEDGGQDSSGAGTCVSNCAHGLGECARGYSLAARVCRLEQCSGLSAADRAACVQQCAAEVHSISEVCPAQFRDCVAKCD